MSNMIISKRCEVKRPNVRLAPMPSVTYDEFDRLLDAWFGNMSRVLVPGGSFYIWGGYANIGDYPAPLKRTGLYFSQVIIWDKMHPVLTRKDRAGSRVTFSW